MKEGERYTERESERGREIHIERDIHILIIDDEHYLMYCVEKNILKARAFRKSLDVNSP